MNRLVLIGNGFDLAHGLKTSYKHFVEDYLANALNSFFEKNTYSDPLLEIKFKYAGHRFHDSPMSSPKKAYSDLKNLIDHDYVNAKINSTFFSGTLEKLSRLNWVDLEIEYFDQLLSCKRSDEFHLPLVQKLNTEFNFLKEQLERYLTKSVNPQANIFLDDYRRIFIDVLNKVDFVDGLNSDQRPSKILLLNFNYTKTLERYRTECSFTVPTDINYIHGELNSNANPIIFGFGDEYNKTYQKFEDFRNKELLYHIKSFGYSKTSNYHNLLRFINSSPFQVCVLGHSLGLSDRTMLKGIFEHPQCKSVKIYYHKVSDNSDDYADKTYDISAHFTDKNLMRKKLVPYSLSSCMPQVASDG